MKIFVIGLDKFNNKINKPYYTMVVNGNKFKSVKADYYDNTGINISNKNKNYCELTGLYWIWKNIKDDVVGLVHYRRFFYKHYIVFNKKNVLSQDDINDILDKYDIIVPQVGYTKQRSVYEGYGSGRHDIKDMDICIETILELYPDYKKSIDDVLMHNNHYSQYNMFICKKELIDDYCEWLFNIFEKLEKKIDLSKKDSYNQRLYGFLSERLFNVWIDHKGLKVKQLPVYNIEQNMFKQIINSLIKKIIFNNR